MSFLSTLEEELAKVVEISKRYERETKELNSLANHLQIRRNNALEDLKNLRKAEIALHHKKAELESLIELEDQQVQIPRRSHGTDDWQTAGH